jgi:hypothetical protein
MILRHLRQPATATAATGVDRKMGKRVLTLQIYICSS